MKTLKKGSIVTISAKRWFDKTYGNTYHSCIVLVNGEQIGKCPFTYGYGDHYLQTAEDILWKVYKRPAGYSEHYHITYLRDFGIKVNYFVSDVQRRKDL